MVFVLLSQAVWGIYLMDHLYDTRSRIAVQPRRIFFKKYRNVLIVVFLLNLCWLFYNLVHWGSYKMILYATPVAVITVLYLLVNWFSQSKQRNFYIKEILIAMGYAGGVMVIPFTYSVEVNVLMWWSSGYVFLLALWNVMMVAFFEDKANSEEGQTTASQWLSMGQVVKFTLVVIIIYAIMIITSVLFLNPNPTAMVIWMLMGAWCLIVWGARDYLKNRNLYLNFVDTVFILPAIYFLPFI